MEGFQSISSGIGHSDIRGLVTDRSMVRREFYCLIAWITEYSVPT